MTKPKQPDQALRQFTFTNRFTTDLPADLETSNRQRQVHSACFSRVVPVPAPAPVVVSVSPEAARCLDLTPEDCQPPLFTQVFAGNHLLPGMDPHASCYGGHQFGSWAGQLGDGRAINLGEIQNKKNEFWTIQLKGAGPTPYSRHADGLAVFRSSLREYLCSEAMFHLGVPTTRALSVILTGNNVVRDMFYDGHPQEEPGAVVCRLAPSFLRFGHFELPAARQDIMLLKTMVDHTIATLFPHLSLTDADCYLQWFQEICRRTATLLVHWQRVGFVHGVMNTDNMSILGLTIDYGPYGWLEDYDPTWTPNTTDSMGRRYCYGRQPAIAHWNLAQLANALYPLIGEVKPLEDILNAYSGLFQQQWQKMMVAKLGLPDVKIDTDQALIEELFGLLAEVETDMTLFFRMLAEVTTGEVNASQPKWQPLQSALYQPEQLQDNHYRARLTAWLERYSKRLRTSGLADHQRRTMMNAVNPKYVLRNYLVQQAIEQGEKSDFSLVAELLETIRAPYDEQPEKEHFAQKRPEWARHRPGCSMLSCSS